MRKLLLTGVFLLLLSISACSTKNPEAEDYRQYSRFTNPGEYVSMLDELPDDVIGICEVAKRQMVHRNLLPYFGIPYDQWGKMTNVWPPDMPDLLQAVQDIEPHNLYDERPIEQRLIGDCMKESHFLAGMLRYKNIPVRIRAGYFKDVRGNSQYVIDFWTNVSRVRGIESELLESNPEEWKEAIDAITRRQNEVNHYIEHWLCEHWDENENRWRLIDANNTFLQAACDIEVGFHLPKKHYEFAWEAWKKMRNDEDFNPDQYRESQWDGRTHIRSQLLWDFYSLLNHDLAGFGQPTRDSYVFIKEKTYDEATPDELEELDELAELLSHDPDRKELTTFYETCTAIRFDAAEKDSCSFVFRQ
jgi:hypothetical protein